ncbi:MAG: hypothetical protein ACKO3W_12185, partial [bacterium]
ASRRNLLASWRAVDTMVEGFPSRERYVAALDTPNTVDAPSRATSIDFRVEWLGALAEGWGRLPSAESPVAATVDRSEGIPRIVLTGSLKHALPAPLEDVIAIHIWPTRNPLQALKPLERGKPPERRFVAQLPNRGAMVALPAWNPGQELKLAELFPPALITDRLALDRAIDDRYYAPIYRDSSQFNFNMVTTREAIDLRRDLEMLSIYGMLKPPVYLQNPPSDPSVLRVPRLGDRALDLSDYFTQPCLIIMGWISAPLPYPLAVNGESVPSTGRVLVRWIQPLPAAYESVIPERIPRAPTKPSAASEKETGANGGKSGGTSEGTSEGDDTKPTPTE